MKKRSLYDCMEARYPCDDSQFIYCRQGHLLRKNGVSAKAFWRCAPLTYLVCQDCPDFNDADAELE